MGIKCLLRKQDGRLQPMAELRVEDRKHLKNVSYLIKSGIPICIYTIKK